MPDSSSPNTNDETMVKCPISECDEEKLSRGIHLHVRQSSDEAHGAQGEVPDHVSFDDLEPVGTKEVEMDYPDDREAEDVARLCPYCERPFKGREGVMIHLGQMAGRKNHPESPRESHDPNDFAIVRVDDDENIVEVVEPAEADQMPSTTPGATKSNVVRHIGELRERGLEDEAERAERILLGTDGE